MYTDKTDRRGFTLTEIMIVVGVIGILASIGAPSYLRARHSSQSAICIANLRQIEHAVQIWALDNNKPDTATPTWNDLVTQYLKAEPSCPAHGAYAIGSVAERPTCSLGDPGTKEHILPQGI